MAKVSIKRDFAEEISRRVNEKTESLLNTVSMLGNKLNDAKAVYSSDNSSGASFDAMSETVNKIISSYRELNDKFRNALIENIEKYSETDKNITNILGSVLGINLDKRSAQPLKESSKTNKSIDKILDSVLPDNVKETLDANKVNAVASVPLTSGIMDSIASTPTKAKNKEYIEMSPLTKKYVDKEGDYTFEYRNDGSVKIKRDGKTLGYTTKDKADWFLYTSVGDMNQQSITNDKLYKAFEDGENGSANETYDSFEERAMYEAGIEKKINNSNYGYKFGVDTVEYANTDGQKNVEEAILPFYTNAGEEDINMYEQGIRDASVNESAANEAIEQARKIGRGE